MTYGLFRRWLERELHRDLQQSTENLPSRRIEGALVQSEDRTYFRDAVIIVDDELDRGAAEEVFPAFSRILSRDDYYRYTKYMAVLWKNNSFLPITSSGSASFSSAPYMKKHIMDALPSGSLSGDWPGFYELYHQKLKKVGKVFLITSEEKMRQLEPSGILSLKKLVVLYPTDSESAKPEKIIRIPCIPYVLDAADEADTMENREE